MSLELFINSGSITEIDLSRIDGVRFEDAFSVSSTTCATLYYNVQDFSIPPVTPVGVLNIPETNYFMFDENAASDWNATTPTKIRISLKALGRILDRTAYQQKLFDIIKNRRVDSEITLTKLPTLNDSDPKSLKKFKITEVNYLERTYDDDGQKFYSLEWGGTDLTETADFTGLFDYLPSSEDRKDGFFTLTVQQLDSEVNNDEPPSQGDELLICIKPSAKYGLLDVVDSTFDTITVDNILITSASVDSLIVNGNTTFLDTGSIEATIRNLLEPKNPIKIICDTAQYVEVPKWAKSIKVTVIGGGGGGGAGVDLNDAHFTLGGSGGSGGSITSFDFATINKRLIGRDEVDLVIYVQPGAGGKGGVVANNLVIEDENDALQQFKNAWNYFNDPQLLKPIKGFNNPKHDKIGARPFFYGLNIDYAYSLIIGDLQTKYSGGASKTEKYQIFNPDITPNTNFADYYLDRYKIYRFDKFIPGRKYDSNGFPINRNSPEWWKEEREDNVHTHWFRKNAVTYFVQLVEKVYGGVTYYEKELIGTSVIPVEYDYIIFQPNIDDVAKTNLRKMYVSNSGGDGSPSYAALLDFTEVNKETDPQKKLELIRIQHYEAAYGINSYKLATAKSLEEWREAFDWWFLANSDAKAYNIIITHGGSGGLGGIAIKYSKNIKVNDGETDRYWSTVNGGLRRPNFISKNFPNTQNPVVNESLSLHVFNQRSYFNWSKFGYGGLLEFIKNDIVYANGVRHTKAYNPIPFVESAASKQFGDNRIRGNFFVLDDAWAKYVPNLGIIEPFVIDPYNVTEVYSASVPLLLQTAGFGRKDYRGGMSGYGVSEPIHNTAFVELKTNRDKIFGIEAYRWDTSKDLEYYNGEFRYDISLAPQPIRMKPLDYYLHSSPNSPQNLITETNPSSFFTVRYDNGVMFSRVRKWEIIGVNSFTEYGFYNIFNQDYLQSLISGAKVSYLYSRPFNLVKTPLNNDAFISDTQTAIYQERHVNDDFVGVTGGAGGLGWTGFDPIGKHKDTGEIIDIMDMSSNYLAEVRVKNPSYRLELDFNTVSFFNYDNFEHIKVGKGGTHRLAKEGDNRYQVGGDGGNAIRRWIYKDGQVQTILPPSLPFGTDPNPPIIEGVPVISWGAGGGAGGSGGIDISNSAEVSFTNENEHGTKKAIVYLDDLLDENNEWRKVGGQNGADGHQGVVIVEFNG
jgi:hypothetical protein